MGWRLALIALVTVALATVVAWIKSSTWNRLERLEMNVAQVEAETYFLGDRVRDGIERMNGALLRFQLSKSDQAEKALFYTTAGEMEGLLIRTLPRLDSQEERALGRQLERAYRVYLTNGAVLLDKTLRAVRRDSSAQVHEQIVEISQPVLRLCENLAQVQHAAWDNFLGSTRQSLISLQRLFYTVTLLLLALGIAFAFLIYRLSVAPLYRKLGESQSVIERQEKLASLGTLAAGVAHEIRNPLTAIKFRLFSLKKQLPQPLVDNEDIQVIGREINRLERIVKDFLQFARPSEPEMVEISAERLLTEVESLLKPQLEKQGIEIRVEAGAPAWLRVDRQQMEQVLINLVQNGADSIGRQGRVTLRARHGASRLAGQSQPAVVLEVEDTGKGIPPEVQKRLFDPFYSTKEAGVGLGLAIAERIVEKHGGTIQYHTQINRGTIFQIILPLLQKNERPNPVN